VYCSLCVACVGEGCGCGCGCGYGSAEIHFYSKLGSAQPRLVQVRGREGEREIRRLCVWGGVCVCLLGCAGGTERNTQVLCVCGCLCAWLGVQEGKRERKRCGSIHVSLPAHMRACVRGFVLVWIRV